MPLPIFDGSQDAMEWADTLCRHFEAKQTPENEKLAIARALLTSDVRACVTKVGTCLDIIKDEKWIWSWSRLKLTLISMQTQIREVQKVKRNAILKGVAIAGGGIAISVAAAPFAFLGVIGAMGFGAGGVAAGSAAAAIQSSIGAVEAGSLFAFCQSAAAGGAAVVALGQASTVAGIAALSAGSREAKDEWERVKKEKPSGSWEDGEYFRPAPQVIEDLIDAPL